MKRKERNTTAATRLGRVLAVLALLAAMSLQLAPIPGKAADAYPPCAASHVSLVDALGDLGVDASFAHRKEIAAANGVSDYTGAAAQNIHLLTLLKAGALLRPGDTRPLEANLARVAYIAQGAKTCKATAVAMAVNLLRGTDACTTAAMGGNYCQSIGGVAYLGSDGRRYQGVYRTDAYVGSAGELYSAIETALSAGVPIVAAVHSTRGGTKHHWVLVVGRSGGDYLVVDPAYGAAGTLAANARTLSARGYALGLTDYAAPHYGYVTFTAR